MGKSKISFRERAKRRAGRSLGNKLGGAIKIGSWLSVPMAASYDGSAPVKFLSGAVGPLKLLGETIYSGFTDPGFQFVLKPFVELGKEASLALYQLGANTPETLAGAIGSFALWRTGSYLYESHREDRERRRIISDYLNSQNK